MYENTVNSIIKYVWEIIDLKIPRSLKKIFAVHCVDDYVRYKNIQDIIVKLNKLDVRVGYQAIIRESYLLLTVLTWGIGN